MDRRRWCTLRGRTAGRSWTPCLREGCVGAVLKPFFTGNRSVMMSYHCSGDGPRVRLYRQPHLHPFKDPALPFLSVHTHMHATSGLLSWSMGRALGICKSSVSTFSTFRSVSLAGGSPPSDAHCRKPRNVSQKAHRNNSTSQTKARHFVPAFF